MVTAQSGSGRVEVLVFRPGNGQMGAEMREGLL